MEKQIELTPNAQFVYNPITNSPKKTSIVLSVYLKFQGGIYNIFQTDLNEKHFILIDNKRFPGSNNDSAEVANTTSSSKIADNIHYSL